MGKRSNMFLEPVMLKNREAEVYDMDGNVVAPPEETNQLMSDLRALPTPVEKEVKPTPQNEEDGGFEIPRSAIIGGIPLLVGALAGDIGTGASVGGKAIMSDLDRQYEMEKLQFKQNQKAKESGIMYRYIDPKTGKAKFGYHYEAHGNEPAYSQGSSSIENMVARGKEKNKLKKESAQEIADIKEKEEIQKEIRHGEYGDTFQGIAVTKDMKKQAKDLEDRFYKSNKTQIDALKDVDQTKELLKKGTLEGNDAAVVIALRTIARMKDKGALSDRDANIAREQLSLVSSAKERAYMERYGTLSPRMTKNISESLKTISQAANKVVKESAGKMSKDRALGNKQKQQFYMSRLMGYIPEESDFSIGKSRIKVTNGKKTYIIDADKLDEAKKDGFNVLEN